MRSWLQKLVDDYLPAVEPLTNAPADRDQALELATAMKQAWCDHGLATLKQQHSLMTSVRNAIKQRFGEEHIAFETLNFTTDEWIEINRATTQRVSEQNASQVVLDPGTVNAIVSRATNLLGSRDWAEIAAGLVVLTGRRSTEILKTAQFEFKTEFSVTFSGSLKRKGEATPVVFEIPTLCQAEYVVKALSKLRQIVPTSELTNVEVNQSKSDPVAKACDRVFSDLVKPPVGKDNLYTHLFRKIYATVATYFYCPMDVDEAEFRAEIQGHFSGHESLTLAERRSIASDRHYRSYVIADADGNLRKGVRLGWQGVQVIEAFKLESTTEAMQEESMTTNSQLAQNEAVDSTEITVEPQGGRPTEAATAVMPAPEAESAQSPVLPAKPGNPSPQRVKTRRPELHADDIARMTQLMAKRGITGAIAELFHALLDAFESGQSQQQQEQAQTIGGIANTLNWFTTEIEALKIQVSELQQERDALKAQTQQTTQSPQFDQLRAENERLQHERDEAVSKLEAFRRLLGGQGEIQVAAIAQVPTATSSAAPSPTPTPKLVVAQPSIESAASLVDERDLDPGVLKALQALMDYNNAQTNHADKWAISFPAMKDLCKQVGAATQSKIDEVFKAKAEDINQHHRDHGLGQRHNRVHQGQSISDYIKL